jgi:probable H4MPT-linked C1 transfer pathway protein
VRHPILGWDIGGANIKAALIEGADDPRPAVVERPFALWREPRSLPAVLAETANRLPPARTMAVTMTAELSDCFTTKREGVAFVLDAFKAVFGTVESWIYGVDGRFRSIDDVREQPQLVAAANWMAGATLTAQTVPDALFIDVGSTTSDVVPIVGGRVVACGRTDPDRLRSGDLVYTGALRTPVCAVVSSVPLSGGRCRVAAEHFAIAADVHLWLGNIDERDYTCDTPDGRGRSRSEAGARLARVVCADTEMISSEDITSIAEHVARAQARQIAGGIRQVLRRLGSSAPRVAVLAGQGTFLAKAALRDTGLEIRDLSNDMGAAAARAAPAAAVACLLAQMATVDSH